MKNTTSHHNFESSINTYINIIQNPAPIFKNHKKKFNTNLIDIHLLIIHDFIQISISQLEITQMIISIHIICISK
jgi:hypothetical protein